MPSPKPLPLGLSEQEEFELSKLVKRHNVAQQIAIRGRIVLAAGAGSNNSEIAREYDLSHDTVRLWRQRWLDLQPIPLRALKNAWRTCLVLVRQPGLQQSSGVRSKHWLVRNRRMPTGP